MLANMLASQDVLVFREMYYFEWNGSFCRENFYQCSFCKGCLVTPGDMSGQMLTRKVVCQIMSVSGLMLIIKAACPMVIALKC